MSRFKTRTDMSRTPKSNRVWNKQEKQIVRLHYRKGLLSNMPNLYWASYRETGKRYKNKGSSFIWRGYLDEVYYCTWNYWGECDEHPLIDEIIDNLIEKGIPDSVFEDCGYDYYKAIKHSSFQYKGRRWFIKYLKGLPTVRCDSKINKLLKIND